MVAVTVVLFLCAAVTSVTPAAAALHKLGDLVPLAHRVTGSLHVLDRDKLLYSGYSQDGSAPGMVVRYKLRGSAYYTVATKYIRPAHSQSNDDWVALAPNQYLNGVYRRGQWDMVIPLVDRHNQPVLVTEVTAFDVYCQLASAVMAEFTQAERFQNAPLAPAAPGDDGLSRQMDELLGRNTGEECATFTQWACHQLSPRINLHWKLNRDGLINFRVEAHVAADTEYVAVGISGREDTYQMVGGDVVVAYIKDNVATARDYYLTAKSQCASGTRRGRGSAGACPDTALRGGVEDVQGVSGQIVDGVLRVSYSRRNVTGSALDRVYRYRGRNQIIWAIGPLASETSYPLFHSDYSHSNLEIDLCQLDTCAPLVQRSGGGDTATITDTVDWQPQCIENQQTLRFEIGPAGFERGYTAITGNPSWGIAYYVNGLLIPYILVERGRTYTIVTATSNQHPVYIAINDKYGGYKSQVIDGGRDPGNTEVLAGIDASTGESLAQGQPDGYCLYEERELDSYKNYESFESFKQSLNYTCLSPGEAEFTWTVPNDMDIGAEVYYQCALHQHLGWRFIVTDPDTNDINC